MGCGRQSAFCLNYFFFVIYGCILCLAGTGLACVGIGMAEAEVGPLGALHVRVPIHVLLPL